MRRPRIGLNCDVAVDDAGSETLRLSWYYADGVLRGGGLPVMLPPAADVAGEMVAALDGLVLVGGRDYDPAWYGETPHAATRLLAQRRMAFDLALARAARAARLPTLGICGGEQLLCLAHGGSLIQHVADGVAGALCHTRDGEAERFHAVAVESGSRLASVVGATSLEVNSSHHQAVRVPGEGLRVVARAPDGVVEAIEGEGFTLGVQWHPERLLGRGESVALFAALVDAASQRPGGEFTERPASG